MPSRSTTLARPDADTWTHPRPTGPPPALTGWSVSRLFRHSLLGNRRWRMLTLGMLGFVLHQVSEALVPVLVGTVVDKALIPRDGRALVLWLGVLATVFVVLALSWRTGMRLTMRTYAYGTHDLRNLVVRRSLDARGSAAPRAPGEVLAVATSDTSRVGGLAWLASSTLASLAAVLTASVALLLVSVPLGLAVLVTTPAVLVAMHYLSVPLERRSEQEQSAAARAGTLATDSMTGLRVLKGLGAEQAASDRYRAASRESLAAALRAVRAKAGYSAVSTAISSAFLAGIAFAAGWMALHGTISTGELVTVVGLAQFVQRPMESLGYLGVELATKRASARRVERLVGDEPVFDQAPTAASADARTRTPDDTALLTLRSPVVTAPVSVRAGDVLGLVVPDAARSRTLVDVLGLRVAAEPGSVEVGGVDLSSPDHAARSLVFAAEHDAAVFRASVADNLLCSDDGAVALDPRALAASGVTEVLTHLPDGVDSPLTTHGRNLSGGQRQRLLLGRALHRPQPVLVLLDPTTAVDTMTEAAIAQGLRTFPEKAVVVVTTSPTLLAACDTVVLLGDGEDGDVRGTHQQLLREQPRYQEVVSA